MKRDQKLVILFATIALVTGLVVVARLGFGDAPPVLTVERQVPVGPDGRLTLQFVGDTYLGDAAQEYIDEHGYDWPFEKVKPMLDADFTIATAEAALTHRTKVWNPSKKYSYMANPASAAAMARAGIDGVTLANNHVFDAGPEGLADTMEHAEAAGLAAFGAGPNIRIAERPLLLKSEIGTIGIVGLGESFGFKANEDTPGTVVLEAETVERGAALARKAGADWVIAYVHWGDNYAPVNEMQQYWAQQLAAAGYDLVVGSGPHVSQPIDVLGSVPVFYSVGNFVFGTRGSYKPDVLPGYGLSAEVEFPRNGKPQVSVRCIQVDNKIVHYQPRPCSPAQASSYLPTLNRSLKLDGDRGVLPCECFIRGRR